MCRDSARRICRYQRGNTNSWIKERQTTQHNGQMKKKKQRSTKHYTENKDRVTRTQLNIEVVIKCYGRVSNSRSTDDTSCFTVKRQENHLTWREGLSLYHLLSMATGSHFELQYLAISSSLPLALLDHILNYPQYFPIGTALLLWIQDHQLEPLP